jgi:hypothetical protein
MLVVWHFPANERFMLPVFPLALAGLLVELKHFGGMLRPGLRHPDRSQRVAAAGLAGVAGLLGLGVVAFQAYMGIVFLPEDARQHRTRAASREPAWAWIRANVPADAAMLSLDDVLLYLHTGRKAMTRPMPPFLWYREDSAGMIAWNSDNGAYAGAHGLTSFEFAGAQTAMGLDDEDRAAVAEKISKNEHWSLAYQTGPVKVYRAAGE